MTDSQSSLHATLLGGGCSELGVHEGTEILRDVGDATLLLQESCRVGHSLGDTACSTTTEPFVGRLLGSRRIAVVGKRCWNVLWFRTNDLGNGLAWNGAGG